MQKVYLLLRNNQQTGPYNLGELSQLQLKNTDLIWIEGKSAGWYYPYEVEELKPIMEQARANSTTQSPPVTPTPKKEIPPAQPPVESLSKAPVPPKKIYVSLPNNAVPAKPVVETKPAEIKAETKKVDEIEQRAEELKRRVQAYPITKEQTTPSILSDQQETIKEEVPPSTNNFFDLDEVPTYAIHPKPSQARKKENVISKPKIAQDIDVSDSAQDLYDNTPTYPIRNRRNSPSNAMQYVAVLFMLALVLGAGWWMYRTFSFKEQQLDDATQQVVKGVQQSIIPADSANQANTAVNQYGDTSTSAGAGKATPPVNAAANLPKTNQPVLKQPTQPAAGINDNKVVVDNNAGKEQNEQAAQPGTENANPVPIVVAKKEEPKVENTTTQASQEPEKKGGFFRKLFGKRTNTDEVSTGGVSSGSEGERNATKREEGTTSSEPVESNITDQVEIKMNVPDDKWMMGVQGVKLKMFNRSNLELKRAAVEVIYYNDQNEVIDRKSVYFSGIPAGKSRTIAAPDHKFADHAGYKVVNAVGAQK